MWLLCEQDEEGAQPDRYVVCGDLYVELRDTLVEVSLGKDLQQTFAPLLQVCTTSLDIL